MEDFPRISLNPLEAIDYLKQTFSDHQFLLSFQREKTLFVRFACQKIVQNMVIKKEKIQITAIDSRHRTIQKTVSGVTGLSALRTLVEKMIREGDQTPPLDYHPTLFTATGHWGQDLFMSELPMRPLIGRVAELIMEGEKRKLDNFAGYFQNQKKDHQLTSTLGGNLHQESSSFQLEMSGFRQNYEIDALQFHSDLNKLNPLRDLNFMDECLNLPLGQMGPSTPKITLSARAVAKILAYAFYTENFSERNLREGIGPLVKVKRGESGEKWCHPLVSIYDNPNPKKHLYTPFDQLGHIRENFPIIEKGAFIQGTRNEREAKHLKATYCGNCQGFRENSTYPYDLEMKGTSTPLHELWAEMGDGYYLHNIHYLSISDRYKMTLFGLTRGGLLEIKSGKPVRKMQNMRIEISIPQLLLQIENLGQVEECLTWGGPMLAPSLMGRGLNFTDSATNI